MRRVFLVAVEGLLLYAVAMTAAIVRVGPSFAWEMFDRAGWLKLLLMTVVVQLCFYLFDLYDLPAPRRYRVIAANIAKGLATSTVLLAILFYAVPSLEVGRGVFLANLAMAWVAMSAWRMVVIWTEGHAHLGVRERVLILGSGANAVEVARATLERRGSGLRVVGFADSNPDLIGKSLINPSVIGLIQDVPQLVEQHAVDRIVVAVEDRRGILPTEHLLNLSLSGRVAVEDSACYYERLTGKIATEFLRPSWLIFSRSSRYSRVADHARRVLNAGLATTGLILSLPLMILVAIAIKLDSRGPVLYTQKRVGRNGRTFKMIKFRSMQVGAEADSGPVWAQKSDPRVTRVGRVIRQLRLDELPQFINILRGDMNFVGPRPERPVFVQHLSEVIPYYSQRHLVRPGLTGWAQIKYPYGASVEDAIEKFRYDLYFIKNRSLMLEAGILFETAKTVMFGRGGR